MPDYVLVRALEWRPLEDGTVEIESAVGGPTIRYRRGIDALLEDIRSGADVERLATHFPGGPAERSRLRARQFLLQLRRLGYVDIPLELPPRLGPYSVRRELGRGGVGVALLCDAPDGEQVVVKRAWGFLAPLEVAERALRDEDAALRALRHPGIVERVDSFEEDGRFHLVRRYVEGEDLGAHERRPLEPPQARAILREAAAIVAGAHAAGYVLLDLRPGNFVRAGRLVLLDVGFARALAEGSVALARPVGAAGFVAPEVARERRATARSDVWSLGALFAFLLTGRHEPRGDVLQLTRAMAPEDAELVARLCAADPGARPDAAEV